MEGLRVEFEWVWRQSVTDSAKDINDDFSTVNSPMPIARILSNFLFCFFPRFFKTFFFSKKKSKLISIRILYHFQEGFEI